MGRISSGRNAGVLGMRAFSRLFVLHVVMVHIHKIMLVTPVARGDDVYTYFTYICIGVM